MKIIIRNLQKKIPLNLKKLKKVALKTLSVEKVKKAGEITICFFSDKQIKELNLLYLGQDCATDVISFDVSKDKKEILADIAISVDAAMRNSRVFKTNPLYEICLYTAHGLLHLLGYDDKLSKQRRIMHKKALEILSLV